MTEPKKKRVVVAMSGGVDSSVAALLLVQQGYEVVGISMRLWSYEQDATHGCCTPEDLFDARKVANQLGIPHYISDFQATFEQKVVDEFVNAYKHGETPNPCVRCNNDLKFHTLLRRANELGADYLATGHYARVVKEMAMQDDGLAKEEYKLMRAVDATRDQSYFLYGMSQKELSQIMFPLGDLTKVEVREIGRQAGIATSDKPDSQEICFVPKDYSDFVAQRIKGDTIKGKLVDESGKVLGDHDGIHKFTVGQRKGIQIPTTLPMYVNHIDKQTGNVTVGSKEALKKSEFDVRELRWVHNPVKVGDKLLTQIRSRFYPSEAEVIEVGDTIRMKFDIPQESISPGQAAVFYKNDQVIGGGWISKVIG
jgi:tRNA-specific 2-thiouridylase